MMYSQAYVDRLKEKIEGLETLLGINERLPQAFITGWDSKCMMVIVNMFLKREFVSLESLQMALGVKAQTARVYLSRARKFFRVHNIEVGRSWGRGWYITAAERVRLHKIIDSGVVTQLPYYNKPKSKVGAQSHGHTAPT